MISFIIDASVILKFLLREDKEIELVFTSLLRHARQKKCILLSSELLPLEVGNGMRFTVRDETLTTEAMRRFFRLPIGIVRLTGAQIHKAIALSYKYNTTVYDASYHVLALVRRGIFVTADTEYVKKADKLGSIYHITDEDLGLSLRAEELMKEKKKNIKWVSMKAMRKRLKM